MRHMIKHGGMSSYYAADKPEEMNSWRAAIGELKERQWDNLWKSQGDIVVNGVPREVSKSSQWRPRGAFNILSRLSLIHI